MNFMYIQYNPFQTSIAFRVETSHLVCSENELTGFYIECNTGQKWVEVEDGNSKNAIFKPLNL